MCSEFRCTQMFSFFVSTQYKTLLYDFLSLNHSPTIISAVHDTEPHLFLAVHMYTASSSSSACAMMSAHVLSSWLRTMRRRLHSLIGCPSYNHVISGVGSPDIAHSSLASSPSVTSMSWSFLSKTGALSAGTVFSRVILLGELLRKTAVVLKRDKSRETVEEL